MNEKLLRIIVLVVAAAIHLLVLFFLVFNTEQLIQEEAENARMMKLTDLDELPPPPDPEIPQVEEIAESMIETDIPPVQEVVAAGTLTETFLEMRYLSTVPQFDMNAITADLVYPPIALRSGIEGRVILELFIDRTGTVQRITIMREDPPDRGFGEAAVRALTGRRGTPATSNGEPVSCRYRFPVVFRIR
ncbi:MAG: energy transducer TonB [Treponema sp.]|jgi:protein TonB|nr:energy transducer TonB [Treponema sp.]